MLTRLLIALLAAGSAIAQVTYQNSSQTRLRVDTGAYGPEIEEVHYCKQQQTRTLIWALLTTA